MKIILRKDVPKLGEAGTLHAVADGYARNYLIPQGFAIVATPGEVKVMQENQRVRQLKIERQENDLQSFADRIAGQQLEFTARAGEQGRLYGSITAGDIADRLSAVVGHEVDRRKVVLDEPIRTLGSHTVAVHLVGRLRPQVTVTVVAEGVPDAAEDEANSEVAGDETPVASAELAATEVEAAS